MIQKLKEIKKCDTLVFGDVLGSERAFLIQNMFPVIEKYIKCSYQDLKSKEFVRVNKILEEELEKKANKVLLLERKGIKLILPDVLEIESKLIKLQLENSSDESNKVESLKEEKKIEKENDDSIKNVHKIYEEFNMDNKEINNNPKSIILALNNIQKDFEGESEKANLKDEGDIENLLKENKN